MPQEGVGELILRGAQGIVRINQMEQQAIQRRAAMDTEQEERDRLFNLKQEQFEVAKKTQADSLKVSLANLKVQQDRVKFEGDRIEEGKVSRKLAQENFQLEHDLNIKKFDQALEQSNIAEMDTIFRQDIALRKIADAEANTELRRQSQATGPVVSNMTEADRKSRFTQTSLVTKAARSERFRTIKGSLTTDQQSLLVGINSFEEFDARYDSVQQAQSSMDTQAIFKVGDPQRANLDAVTKELNNLDKVRSAMSTNGLDRPLTKEEFARAAVPLGIEPDRVIRMFNSTSPAAATSLYHGDAKSGSEEVGAAVRVALSLGNVDGLVAEARKSLTAQKVKITAPVVNDMIDFWVQSAGLQNTTESNRLKTLVFANLKGK